MKVVMDVAIKIVCLVCLGEESAEKIIQGSLEGDGCRTYIPAASHTCKMAQQRFSGLLPEIKDFLKLSKQEQYAQLEDSQWL